MVLWTTNHHEVAANDFMTVSGCDQMVVGPTHARGGTLDHMLITKYWLLLLHP